MPQQILSPRRLVQLLSLFVFLFLTGCASTGDFSQLRPGISTEADVSKAGGKPTYVWQNSDGTRTLEYSAQPDDGFGCVMLTLDAAGKLTKIENAITPANIARIQPGMAQDAVRRILGTPRSKVFFPLAGEDVWDWNTSDASAIISFERFNVHFKAGVVARTSWRHIDPGSCSFISPC